MVHTTVGLIVRQQGWFRAHVDPETVTPFTADKIDAVSIQPTGSFRARVLIGRGPLNLERDLGLQFSFWFDHGEQDYPICQTPSIGPSGASLKMSSRPRKITATADDVLCLIEISCVQPVAASFQQAFESETSSNEADGPASVVRRLQTESLTWLEQAVGFYALYQYPLVWEPIAVHPVVGFVDLATKTSKVSTRIEADNFIPFRLRLGGQVKDGELSDGGLVALAQLQDLSFHLPLALLQRALWHKNVQLRFLETFLILDYLTGQFAGEDAGRSEREELFDIVQRFIQQNHSQHEARINALKHIMLQAPLRQRLGAYLRHLGMDVDDSALGRMLKVRNDLAHARAVDEEELKQVEVEVRHLTREVMRHELAAKGIDFEAAAKNEGASTA